MGLMQELCLFFYSVVSVARQYISLKDVAATSEFQNYQKMVNLNSRRNNLYVKVPNLKF